MKKYIYILAIAIGVWACLPGFVSAHAYISQSSPYENAELDSAPSVIKISFTEKIDTGISRIKLQNVTTGTTIDGKLSSEGDATLLLSVPKLADGIYRVSWQVLSLDTHTTDGSYQFAVGMKLDQKQPDEAISLDGAPTAGTGATATKPPAATAKPKPTQTPKPSKAPSVAPDSQSVVSSPKPGKDEVASAPQSSPGVHDASAAPGTAVPSPDKLENETSPAENADDAGSTEEDLGNDENSGSGEAGDEEDSTEPAAEDNSISNGSGNASAAPDNAAGGSAGTDEAHAGHGQHDTDASAHSDHSEAGHQGRQLWTTVLRVLDVLAGALLAGMIFFRLLLWKGSSEEMPFGFSAKAEKIVIAIAATLWIASGMARLSMLSAQLEGVSYYALATGTMIGQMSVLRLLAALLLLVLALAPERERGWADKVKGLVLIGIIITFPLTGHAFASVSGALAAVTAHAVHMAAAAVWLGGLAGLFSLTFRQAEVNTLNATVVRFSRWALPSMLLVVISGIWLSVVRLAQWSELFNTVYGRLIFAKLMLTLLVIGIAGLHRLVFMPRAAKASAAGDKTAAAKGLARGIRIEVLLAAGLLVLAGTLSSTAPPETAAEQREPFYWHVMGDQAHMSLRANSSESSDIKRIRLDVWLPEGSGEPASAVIAFHTEEGKKLENQGLKLQPLEEPLFEYPGFTKYTYLAEDAYIGSEAKGLITVDIQDSLGNTFHYERKQDRAKLQ